MTGHGLSLSGFGGGRGRQSAGQKQGARPSSEPLVSLRSFLRSPRVLGPTDGPHAARLSSFSARRMAAGTFGLGLSTAPQKCLIGSKGAKPLNDLRGAV